MTGLELMLYVALGFLIFLVAVLAVVFVMVRNKEKNTIQEDDGEYGKTELISTPQNKSNIKTKLAKE